MDRALYINEKKGLQILRDGPSIWVREEGKAGRRIPARLVGNVVIVGNVKMDAGTITLFTDNNVPVTFMNKRGNEVAVTIPHNHRFNSHSEEQKSILRSDENIERYQQWLHKERRCIQLKVIKKLSGPAASDFSAKGFRERDYKDFVARYAATGEKRWNAVNGLISGLLSEMILQKVMDAKLDPHVGVLYRRDNFGAVLDIFYAMEPEADLQTIQFFQFPVSGDLLIQSSTGWVLTKDGIRNVVQRFENKKGLTKRLIDNIIDNLFEIIRSIRSLPFDDLVYQGVRKL